MSFEVFLTTWKFAGGLFGWAAKSLTGFYKQRESAAVAILARAASVEKLVLDLSPESSAGTLFHLNSELSRLKVDCERFEESYGAASSALNDFNILPLKAIGKIEKMFDELERISDDALPREKFEEANRQLLYWARYVHDTARELAGDALPPNLVRAIKGLRRAIAEGVL